MRICQDHWERLKAAIEVRGLGPFIAKNGEDAHQRVRQQIINGGGALHSDGVLAVAVGDDAMPSVDPDHISLDDQRKAFEPLLSASWAIMAHALKGAGLGLMMPNEDGSERCPLCHVTKHPLNPDDGPLDENWINGASDDQLAYAQELGLVPATGEKAS